MRTLALLAAACLLASLLNPNGWKLHAQIANFLRTPELSSLANEFRSVLGLTLSSYRSRVGPGAT